VIGRNHRSAVTTVAAPMVALGVAVSLTSLVLVVSGASPVLAFGEMIRFGVQPDSVGDIINSATTYYLSAVAVAIGFRMNLFNIGVDGQYRFAALLAAYVGGAVALPPVLHVAVTIAVAIAVGGAWAGIAGLLRVTRGVSEVISTIMLNFIATGIVAYLLTPSLLAAPVAGSNNIGTAPIPASGQVPGFAVIPGADVRVYGMVLLAVAVGVGYWVLLGRTRFGFDLRATGLSPAAATASGVNARRMIVATMMLSGAAAGLVGMPELLGSAHSYSLDFPAGLGFTGIAIALLGRNHPVGIAISALLWAFLDRSALILDINDIPKEIIAIMQGVIVLSVVVAYELVRRAGLRHQRRAVNRESPAVAA
jgi:general nucleoside transport system permease protein